MCGRTACTLCPNLLCQACSYRQVKSADNKDIQEKDEYIEPDYIYDSHATYFPSTNIPPSKYTPVLFTQSSQVKGEVEKFTDNIVDKRMLRPMLWGLVPSYFRGSSPTKHGLSTSNARIEGLLQSKLYRPSLMNYPYRRCVVICDGYYEWKSTKSEGSLKQPYFIHAKQDDTKTVFNCSTAAQCEKINLKESKPLWDKIRGWTGPKLLRLAGLYSIWQSPVDPSKSPVYSYTIITKKSDSYMEWLHDRMPVFLDDETSVDLWLDSTVSGQDAFDLISTNSKSCPVSFYAVSRSVGNSRNQDSSLLTPVELFNGLAENKSGGGQKLMMKWLQGSTKKCMDDNENAESKKFKKN